MIAKTELTSILSPRKFYVKRRQLKEEEQLQNPSIFSPAPSKDLENFSLIDDMKKFQTLTTAIENTITLNSNPQDTIFEIERPQKKEKSDFLPPLNLHLQTKLSQISQQAKSTQLIPKKKALSSTHISDPQYIVLEKTMPKRVSQKFGKYKKGWADYCQRRREKSLIERSLERAARSIQQINLDADRRQNTTELSEMLRNNIAEKKFIFPGMIRPEIAGLKGKGGKVVPIFSEVFLVQQVYKYDKRRQQEKD